MLEIIINIDSRNGLLPGGIKSSPKPTETHHQGGPTALTGGIFAKYTQDVYL